MEWAAEVVGIETGDDDALTHVCKPHGEVDNVGTNELRFIKSDDFSAPVKARLHLGSIAHGFRANAQLAMGDDVVVRIALVDAGLENLHALAGDFGTAEAANEFFAFAAEHGTADHLDPPDVA